MKPQQHIVITGASRGLGAALARRLAGQGIHLDLCARDISEVSALSEALIALGSTVAWAGVDVADTPSVTEWIDTIYAQSPIDMLILNAGIFDGKGEDGALETPARAAALIGTNLTSAVVTALTVAQKMRDQNHGHISLSVRWQVLRPMQTRRPIPQARPVSRLSRAHCARILRRPRCA